VRDDAWILVLVHPARRDSAALSRAVELAEAMGASVRLLSVEPTSERSPPTRAPTSAARTVLPAVGLGVRIPAAEVVTLRGDPLRVVASEASRRGVAMVVVGRSRRGWWARGGRSPLHARLVEQVSVPVVVVGTDRRRPLPAASAPRRPGLTLVRGGRADSPRRDETG
jgi:nucleotide-binding universal stress UspA family protein